MNESGPSGEITRRFWWAAATVLAGSLSLGAQQQPSNACAGWPCGARLDPSYFHVAEGTGGHLLLLAPEEIGDSAALLTSFGNHPQTIFRLAGSVAPGLHEFQVPIDPSVESVLFSISVQCVQASDVVRPSGALAVGDDVTNLSNFLAEHMVIVRQPEPGMWTVRLAGSGIAGVVVQAKSAIGIGRVEFAPAPGTTFAAVPSARGENTIRIRISGRASDVHASLVSGAFLQLAELALTTSETEGTYVSRFTPGAEGFRVVISGEDADGFAFQRVSAPLLTPTAPGVAPR
jgi:hypothetical protein